MQFINTLTKSMIMIMLISLSVTAQPYDFPIKPGTPEWKSLSSHAERLKVCQIPETIIKKMTTDDLLQTCLNYPFYGDMMAYNTFQQGIENVISDFNGLQEFLRRKDAGANMIECYQKMNPESFDEKWTLVEKGEYAAKMYYLEILMAQDVILTNLNKDKRIILLSISMQKYQSKLKYPEIYSILSLENIALLMGRILLKQNYEPFVLKISKNEKLNTFIKQGVLFDTKLINEIVYHTQQYLIKNR